MELKLSIIIPFYNAEKYLAACLMSLYQQNIPENEYEVICVNDCSPDKSREIIIDLQQKHANLILIEHAHNKMTGGARNTGIHIAKGKYLWFIDADDFVTPDSFKKLIETAETNQLEILEFNAMHYYANRTEMHSDRENTGVIKGTDFIFDPYEKYAYKSNSTWCKLFLKDFITSKNFYFQEKIRYEDLLHSFVTRLHCERYMFINFVVYHYRFNENSYTQTFDSTKIIDFYNNYIQIQYEFDLLKTALIEQGYDIGEVETYNLKIINNMKPMMLLKYSEKIKLYKNFHQINKHKLQLKREIKAPVFYFPGLILLLGGLLWWPVLLIKKIRKNSH